MVVKVHTSFIGETGYNCHSRNFFKALNKLVPVQIRNYTVGSTWNGYNNDEPHNKEYYMDDILKTMMVEQTLNTPNGREEFPLYTRYKNEGTPDVHIVLNETDHHYFYDNYTGKKIAYNVWETTRYSEHFFQRLNEFDQVWVPSKWQKECLIEQGMSSSKVKVVPEGVDVKTYKPKNYVVSNPVNRPFRFLLVGRWDYRKATKEIIETFIKTFSEDENVELLVNIDNPFAYDGMNSTEERFEKYGLKHSKIKILHHLSKQDYVETLKSADVFLSCARGEGWNLPLIEAMSSGVPSIYSNWGAQLEFAEGCGIPVDIVGEVPANVQGGDLYFSWTKDAPGNFAEPNFENLSLKMRDAVDNYVLHKKKALDDSDMIREKFKWENAAKIAHEILKDFLEDDKPLSDDSVAIVLSHANNSRRKEILKECLSSLNLEVILATNCPVDEETQNLADWVIFSKENPILLKDDFEKYGVSYFSWWKDTNGQIVTEPFEYEHGYAAYDLTRIGIQWAKKLGKKTVHIINYDYLISGKTLQTNEKLLEENDIVLYTHPDWDFGNKAYCSAFFSANIDIAESYFTKYKDKDSYYRSMSGFNILEINMFEHYKDDKYEKCIQPIDSLKGENSVNREAADNTVKFKPSSVIGKSFKEISDFFECDKSTYHVYDRYYPMFFEKWRNESINIFEIGIDQGKSVNVWENYFPLARIWGMDISKSFNTLRTNVFKGDQSKIEDLQTICSTVPKCNIIIDDGSHVPEHQLKTFYYLFENMLEWGGVYVIEDVECSYWRPDAIIYGYESGYLNIIDYFSKLNHLVNSHYNREEDTLHIKSITFGANCIIIQKKEKTELQEYPYKLEDCLPKSSLQKKQTKSSAPVKIDLLKTDETSVHTNQIRVNFIDGPFIEITGQQNREYKVSFIDRDTNFIVYSQTIKNNQWVRCARQWFTKWKIQIESNNSLIFEHDFDLTGKRVMISFESSSLGDTLAWIPYVEEFRKKHNCHMIVSTFQNELFQSQYPAIEFVKPGEGVNNLYALYRIGCFYDEGGIDVNKHRTDFRELALQEYATDILGLDFVEIRPLIKKISPKESKKPYICIANHSTAQPKYWNNQTGWQELVDYVKELGYDVYLLSKEEDGYMGNKNPKGVIKIDGKSLEEIGSILLGSVGFVGLGSGLSWYAWGLGVPVVLISGFSEPYQEMSTGVYRIINKTVCTGCFARHIFDRGDWNWCPDHKGTPRQFECTKEITFDMVKPSLNQMLGI